MNRFGKVVVAGACVALGIAVSPSLAVAADKVQDVIVRNTEAAPVITRQTGTATVQVTGTPQVSVAGTPQVSVVGTPQVTLTGAPQVTLTGAPQVTLAGEPAVSVAGTPAFAPAEEPVQRQLVFRFSGRPDDRSTSYTVPEGKRLRIDSVTFHDFNRPASVQRMSLEVGGVDHWLSTTPQGGVGDVVSAPLTLHAHAGQQVTMSVLLDRSLGGGGITFLMYGSWSGVLLPA